VGFADPALDAQEPDAVCLLLEHPLARMGQHEGEPGEGVGVAERRGGRELLAVARLGWTARAAAGGGEAR